MSFGMSFPFGYSPVFNGLDLFTEPRYVRRMYDDSRGRKHIHHQRCGPNRHFRHGRRGANLLDLLTFGNDFFRDWEDENILDNNQNQQIRSPPTEEKQTEKTEKNPTVTSPVPSPSSTAVVSSSVPNTTVSTVSAKKLGEVKTIESDGGVKFEIAFPGLSLEDVKLDLDTKKKGLIVKAEKEFEEKHEDEHGSHKSYKKISFSRFLPLDVIPSASDVKADFADGSLHITVARKTLEVAPEVTPLSIGTSISSATNEAAVPAALATPASSSTSMDTEATVEDADE